MYKRLCLNCDNRISIFTPSKYYCCKDCEAEFDIEFGLAKVFVNKNINKHEKNKRRKKSIL